MRRCALSLLVILLTVGAGAAEAGQRLAPSHERWQQSVRLDVSLEEAVARVRRETGGRILSAETVEDRKGRAVHRIKVLLPSGHVRIVHVDADR